MNAGARWSHGAFALALAAASIGCEDEPPPAEPAKGALQPNTADAPQPSDGTRLWLVRVAQTARARDLLEPAKAIEGGGLDRRIVAADGGYRLLVGPPADRTAAEAVLARVKTSAPEASLLACRSEGAAGCAQWKAPAVSPSFLRLDPEDVPEDDDALVARELARSDAYVARATPYFDPEDDSPLLGMLARVDLVHGGRIRALVEPCLEPKAVFAAGGTHIAVQCVSAEAGTQLLHSVTAFELPSATVAGKHEPCREPRWVGPGKLRCQQEAVDAEGRLSLSPHLVPLR